MPEIQSSSSGLSDTQLKWSYFFVSNKLLLRKILIVILILINCGLWGYSIVGFSFWALDYQRLSNQTNGLLYSPSSVLSSIESMKPQPLNVSDIQSFGGDNNRFDLMSEVVNPNTDWLAEFDYAFIDNASTTKYPGFALPGQRKILLALAQDSASARLEISNIKWTKITGFAAIKNNHDRFLLENDTFIPAAKKGDPSRVKFSLTNQSPYSYWEAGIVVFLYSGSSIAAVNYITIPQFMSESKRDIELNWTRALPNIDSIEIIPEINYLNPANIMPPSR